MKYFFFSSVLLFSYCFSTYTPLRQSNLAAHQFTAQVAGIRNYQLNKTIPTSGQVNEYAEVVSICQNEFKVKSTSGFDKGDKIMIIQMRGASADLTDQESFGDITHLNHVGKYEFLTIQSINGATIITNEQPQFNYAPEDNVQLIKVATYIDSTTNLGDIDCPAWDGSTGGIIVIESPYTLVINGHINANGKGFRGGAPDNASWGCDNNNSHGYFYRRSSALSAPKGEGISSQLINDINMEGRGKIANGGGAGNNVNAGGGGGSNGSSGGIGGFQWISCTDPLHSKTQGIPGVSLNIYYSNAHNRIFMGGGGGGGHAGANVYGGGAGGNGGGIIIIKAKNIEGTGSITSTGGHAANINSQWSGGGGGAGGTVLLSYHSATGSITIHTNGGNGGNAWWPNELGPGGGGGGGILWISGSKLPSGYTYQSSGGSNGVWAEGGKPYGAEPGLNGPHPLINLKLPGMGSVPSIPCNL